MSKNREQRKIRKIRDYILKSGFPSEIEVGNILRKRGWLAINQLPYLDKSSEKIRAVDLFAMKLGLPSPMLGISLLIECKKSEQHEWVFHTQRKIGEFFPALATIADFLKNLQKPPIADKLKTLAAVDSLRYLFGMKSAALEVLDKFSGLHVLDKNIKTGIVCVVPSSKDDFFEATQQINSALESMVENTKSSIVFPVIVFDGELYEFYQENNEIKVLPTNHVQFISFGKNRAVFLIDIVKKSYFSEFLTLIERDFQIFKDFIEAEVTGLGNP